MKKEKVQIRYLAPCIWLLSFTTIFLHLCESFNYGQALSQSLLYFESQRSGRLPYNQRVTWRHHSALTDGLEQGVHAPLLPIKSEPKTMFSFIFVFFWVFFQHYGSCFWGLLGGLGGRVL